MNGPKYADYFDYFDYADFADFADYADYVDYAKYVEYAEYPELLVEALDTWVRSAFGNVLFFLYLILICPGEWRQITDTTHVVAVKFLMRIFDTMNLNEFLSTAHYQVVIFKQSVYFI